MKNKHSQQFGFTLMEMLVTVLILSILAAFAYSSYSSQTVKARRTDAQGALMGLAQAMERHKTVRGTYQGAASDGGNTGAPGIFPGQAPLDGGQKFYDLTVRAVDGGASFTIRATPIATGPQADDGLLEYKSNGLRWWDRNDDETEDADENCWSSSC